MNHVTVMRRQRPKGFLSFCHAPSPPPQESSPHTPALNSSNPSVCLLLHLRLRGVHPFPTHSRDANVLAVKKRSQEIKREERPGRVLSGQGYFHGLG